MSQMGKIIIVDRKTDEVVDELTLNNGLISCMFYRKRENNDMYIDVEVEYGSTREIKKGNSIVAEDEEGNFREYSIEDYEEIDGEVIEINALPTYLNDVGKAKPLIVGTSFSNKNTLELMRDYIEGTGWRVSNTPVTRREDTAIEKTNFPLELMNEYALNKNMNIDFTVVLKEGKIVDRVVTLTNKEEIYTGKEIVRGKDLNSLEIREISKDVVTAIHVEYSEGSDDDDAELHTFSIYNNEVNDIINPKGVYNWDIVESSSDTEEEAREEAEEKLAELSQIQSSFEVDVEDLGEFLPHEKVRFGDSVYIKDTTINPPVILGGEVVGVEYNIADLSTKKYTVGEFTKLKTRFDDFQDEQENIIKKVDEIVNKVGEVEDRVDESGEGLSDEEREERRRRRERVEHNKRANEHNGLDIGDSESNRAQSNLDRDETDLSNFDEGEINFKVNDGESNGAFRLGAEIFYYGIYTIQYDITADRDTETWLNMHSEFKVVSLVMNGEYKNFSADYKGTPYGGFTLFNEELKEAETLSVQATFLSDRDRFVRNTQYWRRFWLGIGEPGTNVNLKNVSIFEGTPKYGTSDRGIRSIRNMNNPKVPDGVFEDTYVENRGFRYYRDYTGVSIGRAYEGNPIVRINTWPADSRHDLMRMRFKIKFDRRAIGHFGFQNMGEAYYIRASERNDAGIQIARETNDLDIVMIRSFPGGGGGSLENVRPFRLNWSEEEEKYVPNGYTISQNFSIGSDADDEEVMIDVFFRDLAEVGEPIDIGLTHVANTVTGIDFHSIEFTVSDIRVFKGMEPGGSLSVSEEELALHDEYNFWYAVNKELHEKDEEIESLSGVVRGLADRIAELERGNEEPDDDDDGDTGGYEPIE